MSPGQGPECSGARRQSDVGRGHPIALGQSDGIPAGRHNLRLAVCWRYIKSRAIIGCDGDDAQVALAGIGSQASRLQGD